MYSRLLKVQQMTDLFVNKQIPFTPVYLDNRKQAKMSFEVSRTLQKAISLDACSVYFSQTTLFEVTDYRFQYSRIPLCFH